MSSNRLVFGSVLSTMHLLLQIAIAFYLTPLMITTLGDRNYGLWILLSTIIGYYGLLDFGISGAVQRFVSKAIGASKHREKKNICSTAFYLFCGVGFLILLLTSGIALFASHLVQDPTDIHLIRSVLFVLGLGVGITFPFRIFVGVLNANLRFDISRYIEIGIVVARTIFIVYVLLSSGSLFYLAVVSVLASIIQFFFMFIFALKVDQDISISPKYFDIRRLKLIMDFSAATFLGQLAKVLSERSGPLIIAQILSSAAVTSFAVAFNFINYFMQLVWAFIGVIGPVLSQNDGRNDRIAISETFIFSVNLCFYLSFYCGSMSILYGDQFISRWLGNQYDDVYRFLIIFIVPTTINLATAPIYYLLNNISKHRELAFIQIFEAIIIVGLSIVLCKKFGSIGAVYGYAIPLLMFTLLLRPVVACKAIGLSLFKFFGGLLKNSLVATISIFPVWYLLLNRIDDNYIKIFGALCSHLIVYILGCYIVGITKNEKAVIVNALPFMRIFKGYS